MYLRYLLLISVVSLVLPLQTQTLSSPHQEAQALKGAVLQTERHPDAMSNFGAMLFIEQLTGYTFSATTTNWQDCSSNDYEVYVEPTREGSMCSSNQQYRTVGWLTYTDGDPCDDGEQCTSGSPFEVWKVDENMNFYSSLADLCAAADLAPCDYLTAE